MCKKIKIQAYDLKSETISGLKDPLKLHIPKSFGCKIQGDYNAQDYYIIPCIQELEKGIYEFNIEEQIPLYSQVFVQLIGHTTYCKDPYFLHSTCTQINLLECMIECNKPIPFVFASSPEEINIGILKAYKVNSLNHKGESCSKNTNTNTSLNSNTGIDKNTNTDLNTNLNLDSSLKMNTNTNQSTDSNTNLNNPHNEIYTIDIEQTIQLRAFIYEEQKYYVLKVKDEKTQIEYEDELQQGNITKTIQSLSLEESSQIQWAFKIVSESYHGKNATTGRLKKGQKEEGEPFPLLKAKQTFRILQGNKSGSIPKDNVYIELEDLQGDCIHLKLSDIFDKSLFNPNNQETLINKNIIFFAYDKNAGIEIPTSGNGIQYTEAGGKKVGIHNAYAQYAMQDYQDWKNRKIIQDKVTSIELKILQTRFSLEFDGKTLILLENQRTIGKWEARSGIPIENLQEDSNENKQRKRFCIPYKNNQSFYYDLSLHKDNTTKPLEERDDYTITTTYNPHYLDLKGIQCNFKEDICKVFQIYNIPESLSIPLKVQYQKRILIIIERFKETTESTKARMNIYIDGKRVGRNGNITNESFNSPLNKTNPYAYILERPGPDSIGGELNLRIPSGRYNALWHKETDVSKLKKEEKIPWNANTLKLYNDFVAQGRDILIHSGNSPKNSDGCLLINQNQIFKDKAQTIQIDNILQSGKKDILAQQIKDKFAKVILGKMTSNVKEFVEKYIEIQIINHFTKE